MSCDSLSVKFSISLGVSPRRCVNKVVVFTGPVDLEHIYRARKTNHRGKDMGQTGNKWKWRES